MPNILKWITLSALISLIYLSGSSAITAKAQQGNQPIIESDETGLSITWTPPEYTISPVTIDGVVYSQIRMPDVALSGSPGYPQLPFFSGLIGLPEAGEAKLEIVEVKTEPARLDYPPVPAPQPIPPSSADVTSRMGLDGGPTLHAPDPAIYTADTFYPSTITKLAEPHQVRDHRIAALTIYPLRVNWVGRRLEVLRFLRLKITFTQPGPATSSLSALSTADPFTDALNTTLLNPEAVRWSAPRSAPDMLSAQPLSGSVAGNSTKILVNQAGLYALSYSDLQNAGLPVASLDPRTLKLSYGWDPRQEIAILVQGQEDGRFDPSDRLLFYAKPQPSRYVDYDVYFLAYGGTNGVRMSNRSGAPVGLPDGTAWRVTTTETNKFYDPLYRARDGDYWYGDKLSQPDHTSADYSISLQSPLTSGPAATLRVWLQGYTAHPSQNPDHRVQIYLNNSFVGMVEWDGKTAYIAALSTPASYLKAGNNQARLTLPGISGVSVEGTWFDAISLTYPTNQAITGQTFFQGEMGRKKYSLSGVGSAPLVFDVTLPNSPRQIGDFSLSGDILTVGDLDATAASYLIAPESQLKKPLSFQPTNLLNDPTGGADYLIITPSSLASAVAPLAAHRVNQGLRVATVDIQAIYDTYGTGRMDPEAIKIFLAQAYQRWPSPSPLYVLLVGDGTYDFKNYSGYNASTLIPPYMAPVDPWWGETASDNRLVTLVGNDNLPDMLIGRLSVSNAAEASLVVNKIIQYETNPPGGNWNINQIFVADNPDTAGDFYASTDQIYQRKPGSFVGRRYYYNPTGNSNITASYFYSDSAVLRTGLLNAFKNGASFVTFYGHSSWEQWAVESFLHLNDFSQLDNQGRLPIVSEMTCFTGFFHHPEEATFDESLLRQTNGGAIAVWGSTGLGVGVEHDKLQEGFYDALVLQGQPRLGTAVMAGKLNLFATGFAQDLLDTFTLFGDPALRLNQVFKPDLQITQTVDGSIHHPGDPVTLTLTVQNTGAGPITDIVLTDNLPPFILSPNWSTTTPDVNVSGVYTWTLPHLTSQEAAIIIISGTIDPSLPSDFAFINVANVSGALPELSYDNNSSTVIVGGRRVYFPAIITPPLRVP